MMNVKELADYLHISPQAVTKKLKRYAEELEPYLVYESGRYFYDENGLDVLMSVGKVKRTSQKQPTTQLSNQNNQLRNEVDNLKRLLDEKERYILSLENDKKFLQEQLQLANRKWWQKLLPGGNDR